MVAFLSNDGRFVARGRYKKPSPGTSSGPRRSGLVDVRGQQAARLAHPQQISAAHIAKRTAEHEVKLLSNLLPFIKPGALLAAERGETDWPHQTFRLYWPQASAHTFAMQTEVAAGLAAKVPVAVAA